MESNAEEKKYTLDQSYAIGLIFLSKLWTIFEPMVEASEGNDKIMYVTFFSSVCDGFESAEEWIEAITRAKKISQEEQKDLQLSEADIFSCACELAKLHNERWKGDIDDIIHLLDSMKNHPEKHPNEWKIWDKARDDYISQRSIFPYGINLTTEPPSIIFLEPR